MISLGIDVKTPEKNPIKTGDIFGNLKVIKQVSKKSNSSQKQFMCRCICRNITTVPKNDLVRGKQSSCGCKVKPGKDHSNFNGHEEIYKTYWSGAKRGARLRNLEFSISIEYAWELFLKQNKKCAISRRNCYPYKRRIS